MFTTYYGDTTDWVNCQTAVTSGDTAGIDINILYGDAQTGSSTLEGNLSLNTWLKNNDPVPGIDIIVERDPEEEPVIETNTDIFGEFSIPALDDGDYKIWVDMPGLPMAGTYSFTVANGTVVSGLDFQVELMRFSQQAWLLPQLINLLLINLEELTFIRILL